MRRSFWIIFLLFATTCLLFPAKMIIEWSPSAESYHLVIATNQSFQPVIISEILYTNYFEIALPASTYYLKVAGIAKKFFYSSYSEIVSFTVKEEEQEVSVPNNKILPKTAQTTTNQVKKQPKTRSSGLSSIIQEAEVKETTTTESKEKTSETPVFTPESEADLPDYSAPTNKLIKQPVTLTEEKRPLSSTNTNVSIRSVSRKRDSSTKISISFNRASTAATNTSSADLSPTVTNDSIHSTPVMENSRSTNKTIPAKTLNTTRPERETSSGNTNTIRPDSSGTLPVHTDTNPQSQTDTGKPSSSVSNANQLTSRDTSTAVSTTNHKPQTDAGKASPVSTTQPDSRNSSTAPSTANRESPTDTGKNSLTDTSAEEKRISSTPKKEVKNEIVLSQNSSFSNTLQIKTSESLAKDYSHVVAPSNKDEMVWQIVPYPTGGAINQRLYLRVALDFPSDFITLTNYMKIKTSELSEGTHILYYKFVNELGREGKLRSKELIIDRTPPLIYAKIPSIRFGNKEYANPKESTSISFSDYHSSVAEKQVLINGKTYNSNLMLTSEFTNIVFMIFASDIAGNTNYYQKELFLDIIAPTIEITHGKNQPVYNKIIMGGFDFFTVNVYDNTRVSDWEIWLDGESLGTSQKIYLNRYADGQHHLTIIARDFFGNESELGFDFSIDSTPPQSGIKPR